MERLCRLYNLRHLQKNCTSASIRAFKSAAFALSRKFVDPGGFVPSKYFKVIVPVAVTLPTTPLTTVVTRALFVNLRAPEYLLQRDC